MEVVHLLGGGGGDEAESPGTTAGAGYQGLVAVRFFRTGTHVASGGTKIADAPDGYTYHVFNTTNAPESFTYTSGPGVIEYIVVAGGGGGGSGNTGNNANHYSGGGGGAPMD